VPICRIAAIRLATTVPVNTQASPGRGECVGALKRSSSHLFSPIVCASQDGCTYERSALMDLFAQATKQRFQAVSPVTGEPLDSQPPLQNGSYDLWYEEVLGLLRTVAPDHLAFVEPISLTPVALSTPIDHWRTDPLLSFSMPLPLSTARASDATARGRYQPSLDLVTGTDAVEEWLRAIGLPMYAHAFQAASVDPTTLMSLSDEDLRHGLGITDRIHRVKLLARRSDLRHSASQKSQLSVPVPATDGPRPRAAPRLLAATTAHAGYNNPLAQPAAAADAPSPSPQRNADAELLFVVVGGGTSVGLMLPLGEPARFTRRGQCAPWRPKPCLRIRPIRLTRRVRVRGARVLCSDTIGEVESSVEAFSISKNAWARLDALPVAACPVLTAMAPHAIGGSQQVSAACPIPALARLSQLPTDSRPSGPTRNATTNGADRSPPIRPPRRSRTVAVSTLVPPLPSAHHVQRRSRTVAGRVGWNGDRAGPCGARTRAARRRAGMVPKP
jgi:hypothetical protein